MRGSILRTALAVALACGTIVVGPTSRAIAASVISPSTLSTTRAHVGDPYQAV